MVSLDACDFDSLLLTSETGPPLSHKATEQILVAVSRHNIIGGCYYQAKRYFSLKRSSLVTISIRVLSDSFLLIALKGALMTLSPGFMPDNISI
jgi:hypothetical protein